MAFLGDFNLADVCWDSLTTKFSDDQIFIDFLTLHCGSFQIIHISTHRIGNVLICFSVHIASYGIIKFWMLTKMITFQ